MHPGPLTAFIAVLRRDLLLGMRHRSELANPIVFFLIVITLFAFALGEDSATQHLLAPMEIWVAALLATMLSLESMFRADFEDGTLEQIMLSPHPLPVLVSAKIAAHWILYGVPLVVASLLAGLLLGLPTPAPLMIFLTLLLGTPVFSLIGSVLAALTIGLRGSGVLLALLILPLYVPVLIFSVAAVGDAVRGLPVAAELYFLGAMLVLALAIMPIAASASLRARLG